MVHYYLADPAARRGPEAQVMMGGLHYYLKIIMAMVHSYLLIPAARRGPEAQQIMEGLHYY